MKNGGGLIICVWEIFSNCVLKNQVLIKFDQFLYQLRVSTIKVHTQITSYKEGVRHPVIRHKCEMETIKIAHFCVTTFMNGPLKFQQMVNIIILLLLCNASILIKIKLMFLWSIYLILMSFKAAAQKMLGIEAA